MNLNSLWDGSLAILIAILGGITKLLNQHGKPTRYAVIAKIVTSVFIGIVLMQVAGIFNLTGSWVGLLCGAGGFGGVEILTPLFNIAYKKVGIQIEEKNKES